MVNSKVPGLQDEPVISESVQNYVKAIYHLGGDGRGASVQDIAGEVGVSAPGVTKMLHWLARHKFVEYTPYQPVHLTPVGEKIALEVIRHHRLLEVYLMESLGFGWEQVHSEAERLEHHISEDFEDAIERMLGFPAFDPHGDPIPTRDGHVGKCVTETLEEQPEGSHVVVRRVTDEDADLLRYLAAHGLRPGVRVRLAEREPFGGSLQLSIGDRSERISPDAARHVFVENVTAGPVPDSSVISD